MERKALIACVGTLLLLQIAGLSQASGTSPQSIVSQPKNDDVDTNSPTADDSVSDTTAVESNDDPSGGSDAQEGGSEEEEDPDRSGKLIAQYTTKTKALFVTTTLTALSTCFSATDVACTGKKKKKRSMAPRNLFIVPGANAELISSQDPPASGESEYEFKSHDSDREERKFTIWTTLFSTHTLTTTFYYPGTTVSISGVCSVPGLESSCFG